MKKNTLFTILVAGCMVACNDPKGGVENDSLTDATEDTAVVYQDENGRVAAEGMEIKDVGADFWANLDWDAPVVNEPDMQGAQIEKRATSEYTIYSLEEQPLFDTDKAQLRDEGREKLQQIADDIKEMQDGKQVRIFGHTDNTASKEYNEELSAERARAVQTWLEQTGGISSDRLSIEAMGETAPRATNETARGRQLNRRVAIVVVTQE